MLGRGASPRTGIDDVEHDARIEPGFDAHDHRLRGRRHRRRGQHVVAELHRLAGAGPLADVEEFADHFERRLDGRDLRARSGRHHRDRAFFGAAHAARYRCIDLHDVARRERLEDALRHHRAGGGQIDETFDALSLDHPVGPGRDLEHDIRCRQAGHDGFDDVGDFLWRARRHRAARSEIADRFLAGVVDHDFMPGLDQPPRHVHAHIAKTDKADVHQTHPPSL